METVGEAVAKAAAPAITPVPWDPAWSRFAGLYRSPGGDAEVVELNQRLVMFDPTSTNPDAPANLVPIGNGRFRYEAPTGGGVVGEVVRFEEVNGKVVRMYTGDSHTERVVP
jgi:D-alanyl-D-alanine carboxypeptidase